MTGAGAASGLLVCLALLGGCSQALSFKYLFAPDDGSASQNDLRATDEDLSASVNDMASADLAVSGDLASNDAAVVPLDMTSLNHDLFGLDLKAATDLTSPDMVLVSPLGGPCSRPCSGGLSCVDGARAVGDGGTIAFPNGYCSRTCNPNDDVCPSYGGKCIVLGDKSICMRLCDAICPTARIGEGYSCCTQTNGSVGGAASVCAVSGLGAGGALSCLTSGTP